MLSRELYNERKQATFGLQFLRDNTIIYSPAHIIHNFIIVI